MTTEAYTERDRALHERLRDISDPYLSRLNSEVLDGNGYLLNLWERDTTARSEVWEQFVPESWLSGETCPHIGLTPHHLQWPIGLGVQHLWWVLRNVELLTTAAALALEAEMAYRDWLRTYRKRVEVPAAPERFRVGWTFPYLDNNVRGSYENLPDAWAGSVRARVGNATKEVRSSRTRLLDEDIRDIQGAYDLRNFYAPLLTLQRRHRIGVRALEGIPNPITKGTYPLVSLIPPNAVLQAIHKGTYFPKRLDTPSKEVRT